MVEARTYCMGLQRSLPSIRRYLSTALAETIAVPLSSCEREVAVEELADKSEAEAAEDAELLEVDPEPRSSSTSCETLLSF